jgi:RNA polymerase sigma-70 factor (ECF subfamily)
VNSAAEDPQLLDWERQLLVRLADGDQQAFVELYRRFAPRLYSEVLMPLLGNPSAAEDALSETFRAALQKIGDYRHDQVSVFFWLRRIARNKALDMHRAAKVTGRALARFEQMVTPVVGDNPSPESLVSSKWDQPALERKVVAVLGQLTPRYRLAIELRFFEERSREECAEQLEVKLGTFDVVLLRALRAFRKHWEAAGVDSTREGVAEVARD